MKTLRYSLIGLLPLVLLLGCGYSNNGDRSSSGSRGNDRADSTSTSTTNTTPAELRDIGLNYRQMIDVDSSDYIIIPVGAADKTARWNNRSSNLYFYGGSSKYDYNHHLNMIFYHLKKDSAHLLLPKERGIILDFTIPQNEHDYMTVPNESDEEDDPIRKKISKHGWHADQFIFYNIRSRDSNFDGVLDHKDSNHLYASRKDGSGLVRLTPANTQLVNWRVLRRSHVLLARVLVDSNDDKIFSQKDGDDIRLIRINLRELKNGRPLLSREQETLLKTQFYDLYVKEAEE